MNPLPVIPIALANRFVGMGKVSRLISLPLACLIIGVCLMLMHQREWWWAGIFGVLFALGRGPNVANGFHLITGEPIDPTRDGWTTRWIAGLSGGSVPLWAFLRISVYYMPLFIAVGGLRGIAGDVAYALCWVASYALVKPLWDRMKWPVTDDCYTRAAENCSCVCFAVIMAVL